MINWPSLSFPPINLWTAPKMRDGELYAALSRIEHPDDHADMDNLLRTTGNKIQTERNDMIDSQEQLKPEKIGLSFSKQLSKIPSSYQTGKLEKCLCSNHHCNWRGYGNELLTAKNPFTGDTMTACPRCKEIDDISTACDVDGCWQWATCSTPTDKGYRVTCLAHKP